MRRPFYLPLAAFVFAAAFMLPHVPGSPADLFAESKSTQPPLFFNITSGEKDVHAVSMALGLAAAARREGREVVLFFNVGAPYFASKDLNEQVKFADFPPVKTLLKELSASGAKVFVCDHCAHTLGLSSQSLAPGAAAAQAGEVLAQLKPGTITLSY